VWIPVPTLIAIWQVFLPGNRLALESHGPSLCCQVFAPLVEKCKKYGRAIRIGTNHGSLSDRIMSYYGDSPRGMVESAFEFANICRKLDFHNFVFSMKASNPVVMVQAYRLLLSEMYLKGWDYPLHLGVTEAGEGEDGRMKSAIGIGALLQVCFVCFH
jgi:(E)-4-hydroxy-3-methylbut-2-enyl-diphosphate synthase